MSWVICVEIFLAVVASSYITMMCFTHPYHEPREGVVEISAPEFTADRAEIPDVAALAATWGTGLDVNLQKVSPDRLMSEPARDEKPEVCKRESAFGTVAAAFLVAFMAGGFMNLERIQGLPLP
jgi:hypothetical protein